MVDAQNRNRTGHKQGVETFVIPIGRSAVATEVDTTYDLPATGVIIDYYLYVATAEATGGTKTLDIGTLSSESGGDADGFFDAVDVSTTGVKLPSLASAAQTRGGLFREDESGDGVLVPKAYNVASATAKSISRTLGSNDWAEFVGYLVMTVAPIPTTNLP